MKKTILVALIVILAVIQATVLNYFKVFSVKPDLLLIAVVIVAILNPFELKLIIPLSIFAGMLKDLCGINSFGWATVLFPAYGLTIIYISRKITTDSIMIRTLFVLIAVITGSLFIALMNWCTGRIISLGIVFKIIFLESVYTALVAFLCFRIPQLEHWLCMHFYDQN